MPATLEQKRRWNDLYFQLWQTTALPPRSGDDLECFGITNTRRAAMGEAVFPPEMAGHLETCEHCAACVALYRQVIAEDRGE